MDKYIKARLERASLYLNNAKFYAAGQMKAPGNGAVATPAEMVKHNLKAGLEEFKKIERYINQCGEQAAADSAYVSIIE